MVIYSRVILVAVTSECLLKRVICKTCTGTFANRADPDQTPRSAASDQGLRCLLKLQKLRIKWKQCYVPVQDHFLNLHSETIDSPVLLVLWFFYWPFQCGSSGAVCLCSCIGGCIWAKHTCQKPRKSKVASSLFRSEQITIPDRVRKHNSKTTKCTERKRKISRPQGPIKKKQNESHRLRTIFYSVLFNVFHVLRFIGEVSCDFNWFQVSVVFFILMIVAMLSALNAFS